MEALVVLITFVSNIGFLVAISALVLYHSQKASDKINELSETVNKNTEAINELKNKIGG